jgi:hypothetical protein
MPGEVELVQVPVVGEHDDLGGQLVLHGGGQDVVERLNSAPHSASQPSCSTTGEKFRCTS